MKNTMKNRARITEILIRVLAVIAAEEKRTFSVSAETPATALAMIRTGPKRKAVVLLRALFFDFRAIVLFERS